MQTKEALNLQMFADGAAGGTAGGEGTGGNAQDAAAQNSTGVKSGAVKGKDQLASVRYGIQDQSTDTGSTVAEDNAGSGAGSSTTEDRGAAFDNLIKGEFKEQFDQRVRDIVQSRLKNVKGDADKYSALMPTLDMLAKKYGVKDASDIAALNKAIQDDDSYYEDEALEKGVTVEQLKEIKRMERENADLRRQMDSERRQKSADAQYAKWMDQSTATKQVYNGFDLNTEVKNPQFVKLLQSGVDVRTAYEVIHKDEIIPAAMQFTAQQVTAKMASSMRAGQNRPAENGAASQSAPLIKSSVSQLTKDDMREIERRVRNGEKIRF